MELDMERKRRIDKVYLDMYEGQGKENPAMTARVARLEEAVDKISANLGRIVWLLVASFLAALGNIFLHIWK